MSTSKTEILAIIERLPSLLTPREEKLIRLRFQIMSQEVAARLRDVDVTDKVTRERCQQIEDKALRKLQRWMKENV